ncbi:hypothetical protein B9Z55_025221 [Caenorhabditis nigoni]|uniref:Uncharacterized protein n=1 Tax=Caenorhabditis nigoni TaxID=1611254 RepID=A0A2G5SY14_9PELO|nr:hypothetical protein B9Z55_025221 [Caenorhabditis nigoni]
MADEYLIHNPEDENIRCLSDILLHLMRRHRSGLLAYRYSSCLVSRFPRIEELDNPAADRTALLHQAWRAVRLRPRFWGQV